MSKNLRIWLTASVLFFLVSALAWRHIMIISEDFQPQLVQIHVGIVSFYSGFKAWQNRVLTAGLQAAMAKVTGSQETAWQVNYFLLFYWCSMSLFGLFWYGLKKHSQAYVATLLTLLLYVVINDHRVCHWDLVDMVVFAGFTVSLLRKNLPLFLGSFVFALINRESALYMPLWFFLAALSFPKGWRPRLDPTHILLGGVTFVLGLSWVIFVRSLWKHTEDTIGKGYFYGNHLTIINVLGDYSESYVNLAASGIFFVFVFVCVALFVQRKINLQLFLWFFGAVMSGVLVGGPTEIRFYSFLVPLGVYQLMLLMEGLEPSKEGAFLGDPRFKGV